MYETHASKIRDGISQLRRRLLEINLMVQEVVGVNLLSSLIYVMNGNFHEGAKR